MQSQVTCALHLWIFSQMEHTNLFVCLRRTLHRSRSRSRRRSSSTVLWSSRALASACCCAWPLGRARACVALTPSCSCCSVPAPINSFSRVPRFVWGRFRPWWQLARQPIAHAFSPVTRPACPIYGPSCLVQLPCNQYLQSYDTFAKAKAVPVVSKVQWLSGASVTLTPLRRVLTLTTISSFQNTTLSVSNSN